MSKRIGIVSEGPTDYLVLKEAIQKETLLEEMESSGRTYEEIVEFLRTAPKRSAGQ